MDPTKMIAIIKIYVNQELKEAVAIEYDYLILEQLKDSFETTLNARQKSGGSKIRVSKIELASNFSSMVGILESFGFRRTLATTINIFLEI
ncbi:MAG: hypothetical protein WC459_02975 [Patescibacteria group bacterium]